MWGGGEEKQERCEDKNGAKDRKVIKDSLPSSMKVKNPGDYSR